MAISKELQLGKAGEYLVCADLITKGFVAFPSEQGLPYDVVLDNGKKLIKIQVKATLGPRIVPQRNKESHCYIFTVKRMGRGGNGRYGDNDVDVFALVALESRTIAYLPNSDLKTTMNFRVEALRGTYYDEKGIQDSAKVIQLHKSGMKVLDIAKELRINSGAVYRMIKPDYKPFETEAKYLSDYEREPKWFETL